MTEKYFKEKMAELSKNYSATPNDVQYKAIYNSNRKYQDEYFKKLCDKVLLLFHPTNTNPFPGTHNFYDAHMEIESTRRVVPDYKPIVVSPEELPDEEYMKGFLAEVAEIIKRANCHGLEGRRV